MSGAARPISRVEAAALLEVAPDAAPAEVQRAFLRAARHVHPDTLPGADDAERRAAAERFARLLLARDVLLVPAPAAAPAAASARYDDPRGEPGGPRFRRVEGRGLGGSLVVLALLAFLLVALVTLQQGLQPTPFQTVPGGPPAASQAP